MRLLAASLALAALLAVVAALGAATAQAAAVGALLGVNRCGISGDAPPDAEYKAKAGLLAGAQGEIDIAKGISLSLQPMYVRRGTGVTAVDTSADSGESDLGLALDYFAAPVVVKFVAAGGHTYFAGGVDVAFLTAATLSGDGLDEDVKDSFNSLDVGALLGFGVVFPIGRPRLTAELRYVQGLVNLGGDATGGPIRNLPDRFRSTGLQLTAGILFPLGRP
jgi:hypothetical protein